MLGHLTWGHDQSADVSTVEELDAVLSSIARDASDTKTIIAVELFMDDDTGMCITVGDQLSPACFYSRRGGPLVVNAIGRGGERAEPEGDDLFVFSYHGEYSEVLRRDTLPIETAREGMRLYFLKGRRPDNITWGP